MPTEGEILYLRIDIYWDFPSGPVGEGNGTPVLLPGESHGQRSLVGCGPWGC